ncbi:dTDP-4-dehydrorhamnose 3,5-epimerase [Thermogymnomonas acidicola]|nr:dTDP-4-dehydrorhamnose 3,5-epimerase [Thermogymnomonas acidicola]
MPFEFEKTDIEGVVVVKPRVFSDERGYFTETYKKSEFSRGGIDVNFVQDNESFSSALTLRGLHFQRKPYEQGKLVRCVRGEIFDVAVDLRPNSRTFGKYVSAILSEENRHMLWIPEGFAHGFLALKDSIVVYKVTNEYNRESEGGIRWDDPELSIKWPMQPRFLSDKDRKWPTLREYMKSL